MIGSARDQRGYALLVVLWTVGLLALVVTFLIGAAREQTLMTNEMRGDAELEAAADGAMQHAIFEFLDQSESRWEADGVPHAIRVGRAAITLRLEDEAAKVNPNFASAAQLQTVLLKALVDRDISARLAAAIVAWRGWRGGAAPTDVTASPNAVADVASQAGGLTPEVAGGPFARIDDLGSVPGMTSEILERLRPYLTLYTGDDPDETPGGSERVISIVAIPAARTARCTHAG